MEERGERIGAYDVAAYRHRLWRTITSWQRTTSRNLGALGASDRRLGAAGRSHSGKVR